MSLDVVDAVGAMTAAPIPAIKQHASTIVTLEMAIFALYVFWEGYW